MTMASMMPANMVPTNIELPDFSDTPWWLSLIKAVLIFVYLMLQVVVVIWFERRVIGRMQQRPGPNRFGPWGILQEIADAFKLIWKELFIPRQADKLMYLVAPILAGAIAFISFAIIPLGGMVYVFGHHTPLQLTETPVSVLLVLAVAGIGAYGIILAGWSSGSTYPLLGGLRSTAQVISYEIAMGLSLVAVFLYAGSMSTAEIVEAQRAPLMPFGLNALGMPNWLFITLIPSFLIYVISMVGETNRAPFDLPEAESELVSGYITEYSGFRYAIYFLAEYINMATVSAIATTLFMGGYLPFWPLNLIEPLNNPWLGPIWFIIKVQLFISVFVWLRGTLPRFRYDQFMSLGWKGLIPISLGWIVLISVIRKVQQQGMSDAIWYGTVGAAVVLLLVMVVLLFVGDKQPEQPAVDADEPFDAFAGGYPVPPMPGQVLPELAGVVSSTTQADDESTEKEL